MVARSFFDIVQVITGLILIAGLLLVILELRQTREIATAQQTSDVGLSYNSTTIAEMGEILPTALAKACEDPEHLTGAELMALNGYYAQLFFISLNANRAEDAGLSSRISWRSYARTSFELILASTPGQAWWNQQREAGWIPKEFRDFADEQPKSTECFLDGWRAEIREVAK